MQIGTHRTSLRSTTEYTVHIILEIDVGLFFKTVCNTATAKDTL